MNMSFLSHVNTIFLSGIIVASMSAAAHAADETEPVRVDAEFGEAYGRSTCPIGDAFDAAVRSSEAPSVSIEKRRIVVRAEQEVWVFDDQRRPVREALAETLFAPCTRSADGVDRVSMKFSSYFDDSIEDRAELIEDALERLRAQRESARALYAEQKAACTTAVPEPALGAPVAAPATTNDPAAAAVQVLTNATLLRSASQQASGRVRACDQVEKLATAFRFKPVDAAPARAQLADLASRTKVEYERSLPVVDKIIIDSVWAEMASSLQGDVLAGMDASLDEAGRAVRSGDASPKEFLELIDTKLPAQFKTMSDQIQTAQGPGLSKSFDDLTLGWCSTEGRALCDRIVKESLAQLVQRIIDTCVNRINSNSHVKWVRANYREAQIKHSRRKWEAMRPFLEDITCATVNLERVMIQLGRHTYAECDETTYEMMGMSCSEAFSVCCENVRCECDATGRVNTFSGSSCPSSGEYNCVGYHRGEFTGFSWTKLGCY
jgi:hypothetical protein